MHHESPILRERRKPLQSGLSRRLITSNYRIGETFIIKDCNSYYDMDKIEIVEKKEPQYK